MRTYYIIAFTISGVSALCPPTTVYEFTLGLSLLSLTYLYWDLNRDFEKVIKRAEDLASVNARAIEMLKKEGKS